MKSKRAEEAIERYRKKFTAGFVTKNEVETVKEYCRLFTEVVELAEQDAEEKINHYRKELEESKRREELARNVIDDQRKKIKALKARAAEAFKEYMEQAHGGYLTSDLDNFIQKTQRAMKLAVIIGASWPELIIQVSDTKEILSCDPFVGYALSIPEDVNTVEGYKKYIASRLVGREIIINLDCLRYDGVLLPQENDLKLIEV